MLQMCQRKNLMPKRTVSLYQEKIISAVVTISFIFRINRRNTAAAVWKIPRKIRCKN